MVQYKQKNNLPNKKSVILIFVPSHRLTRGN
jgi:hypothetical protein